jgi:hypothetical protein
MYTCQCRDARKKFRAQSQLRLPVAALHAPQTQSIGPVLCPVNCESSVNWATLVSDQRSNLMHGNTCRPAYVGKDRGFIPAGIVQSFCAGKRANSRGWGISPQAALADLQTILFSPKTTQFVLLYTARSSIGARSVRFERFTMSLDNPLRSFYRIDIDHMERWLG